MEGEKRKDCGGPRRSCAGRSSVAYFFVGIISTVNCNVMMMILGVTVGQSRWGLVARHPRPPNQAFVIRDSSLVVAPALSWQQPPALVPRSIFSSA
jgi:hypothetical protein